MSSDMTTGQSLKHTIAARDLGKCYRIYEDPKARLKQALWRGRKQYYKEFWALRNVSFEIKLGDSLGIIGRNGSGKSTLLQLICGTLTPSEGSIKTHGKIAALLELGSGFNPEFTGLENVYLNASLLGLTKEETDNRLDGILSFADIGDFIHQPVKSYSSGMTVRLAFAVIAHVNADILVVDEALAVGDAVFVQRCMRFIRKTREEGCLLFVSHDAEAVKSLCSHALWLSKGATQAYGGCKEVAFEYLQYCQATSYGEEVSVQTIGQRTAVHGDQKTLQEPLAPVPESEKKKTYDYEAVARQHDNLKNSSGWKTGDADLTSVTITPLDSKADNQLLKGGEDVIITIRARANKALEQPVLGFTLVNRLGQQLLGENTFIARNGSRVERAEAGNELTATFRLWFPMLPSGEYALMASIADGNEAANIQHHWTEDAVLLNVSASKVRYGLVGGFISDVRLQILDQPESSCPP